ncbi:hypothetical protein BDN70DRAFT_880150 [Pholiota conissans]|uniref:Uncharacterized protein n=1 Tax=Pholiota conissans TaxID=109636 RepID=A0A9P5YYV4_9AGAR|nr:hypothetical protein BDN70DRAFT_880150 [Pholiota conissans]
MRAYGFYAVLGLRRCTAVVASHDRNGSQGGPRLSSYWGTNHSAILLSNHDRPVSPVTSHSKKCQTVSPSLMSYKFWTALIDSRGFLSVTHPTTVQRIREYRSRIVLENV